MNRFMTLIFNYCAQMAFVLFFDVDNTIIKYKETGVSLQSMNLFNAISSHGFDHIILISNNSSVERIEHVSKQLNLPAVTFACKLFVFTMRRLLKDYGIKASQSALIGDQLFTDVLLECNGHVFYLC